MVSLRTITVWNPDLGIRAYDRRDHVLPDEVYAAPYGPHAANQVTGTVAVRRIGVGVAGAFVPGRRRRSRYTRADVVPKQCLRALRARRVGPLRAGRGGGRWQREPFLVGVHVAPATAGPYEATATIMSIDAAP